MKIEVRLMAHLQDYLPERNQAQYVTTVIADGTSLSELIAGLDIPAGLDIVVLVNGVYVSEVHRLEDGDKVEIFPPLAGG